MSFPTSYDRYLFHRGRHFRSYQIMGSHPTVQDGKEGVSFCVWAPEVEGVGVAGQFNDWHGEEHPMQPLGNSRLWYLFIPGLTEGEKYKYELHLRDGRKLLKTDPYAFRAEVGPNAASEVTELAGYEWRSEPLTEGETTDEIYEKPMLIYEVHLGSWRRGEDGGYLNYRELADQLVEYVVDMGYTHIELLPVQEYPFDGSWGYQTIAYYAVTSRFGNPDDFMYLVDTCHQSGIRVILDWVPGHFCPDDPGLARFNGTPLYEHADPRRSHNEWGSLNFDFKQPEVWSFLISNALFWYDIYRIDGLRVDAVSNMLYLDHGKEGGEWLPNEYGGNENLAAVNFMRKLNSTVLENYPRALMIAEESSNWPMVTAPPYSGGLGFNYKWNMGWMNDTLDYVKKDPVHRKWHHRQLTFSFMYHLAENYILPLSHDEVVHGKGSLIDRMPGDYWQKFAGMRLLLAYMFTHPGKKLLFMGGEFGQFAEWDYRKELDWFLIEDYPLHTKLKTFSRELNEFYRSEPALWKWDHRRRGFSWIDPNNSEQSILIFMRRAGSELLIILCNFTPIVRRDYRVGIPVNKPFREVFNTDSSQYGGSDVHNSGPIEPEPEGWHGQSHSLVLTVPPLACIILKEYRNVPSLHGRGDDNES